MPLYVAPNAFDSTQDEFTIATIGGEYYLQMGAVSEDNQRLFESIFNGHAGFFRDDERVGLVRVTGAYDADRGVRVSGLPGLMADTVYAVDFSQAQPGRDGVDGEDAPVHFYRGVKPFYRGVQGKFYRGITPFYRGLKPFYRGVKGGFHRGVIGSQDEKRQFDGIDVINLFKGIPEEVANYMWELLMDRIPDPTTLRTEEETFNLIRARIEGYVTGYTEAFTEGLKTKLEDTEIFTLPEKNKLAGVEQNAKDDQTGSELLALLLALPEGMRIPYSWLDGRPTIPTDTLGWGGQWRAGAYNDGTIVVDNNNVFLYLVDIPATNTVRPGDDTAARVEHLDIGSPQDITHAANSGLTITFTRRSGASFNITISPTDIYNAINSMTDDQKTGIRTLISAAAANHNHDGRYYQESEVDNLLAGKSNTGHNHDGRYYQESEVDNLLAGKADANHGHTDLLTEAAARALFSVLGHTHDDRYYTEGEANSRFSLRNHTHPGGTVTVANVLAAILGFSNSQDAQVRESLAFRSGFRTQPYGYITKFDVIPSNFIFRGVAWNPTAQKYVVLAQSGGTASLYNTQGQLDGAAFSVGGAGFYSGMTWNSTSQVYAWITQTSQNYRISYRSGTGTGGTAVGNISHLNLRAGFTYGGIAWNPTAQRYAVISRNNRGGIRNVDLHRSNGQYDTSFSLQNSTDSYTAIAWNPTAQRYAVVNDTDNHVELYRSNGQYDSSFSLIGNNLDNYAGITWNAAEERYVILNSRMKDLEFYAGPLAIPEGITNNPTLLSSNLVFNTVDESNIIIYYYYGSLVAIGFNSNGVIIGSDTDQGNLSKQVRIRDASKIAYLYIPKI